MSNESALIGAEDYKFEKENNLKKKIIGLSKHPHLRSVQVLPWLCGVWTWIIIFRLNSTCHKLMSASCLHALQPPTTGLVLHGRLWWIVGYRSLDAVLGWLMRVLAVGILQTWDTLVNYLMAREWAQPPKCKCGYWDSPNRSHETLWLKKQSMSSWYMLWLN